MPSHRHKHDRSRKRTRSRSPSSTSSRQKDSPPSKKRHEDEDTLNKILHTMQNLSKRVEALECRPDYSTDSISIMADQDEFEDTMASEVDNQTTGESNQTPIEPIQASNTPIQAPNEPIQAPNEPIQATMASNGTPVIPIKEPNGSKEPSDTSHVDQLYNPDATSTTWDATPAFTKFLETNFRRKLSYDQVTNILENWSTPNIEALHAPKADQQVLNQVPIKSKKYVLDRDKEMFSVQRAMLNATAPLCSLHDCLEMGNNPTNDQLKTILEQTLCLLGSANHQFSCLRRQRILASINRATINLADQPLPNAKSSLFGEDFPSIASKQAELSRGLSRNLNPASSKGKYRGNKPFNEPRNRGLNSKYSTGSTSSNYQGGSFKYPRAKNRPFRPSKGRQADSQDA